MVSKTRLAFLVVMALAALGLAWPALAQDSELGPIPGYGSQSSQPSLGVLPPGPGGPGGMGPGPGRPPLPPLPLGGRYQLLSGAYDANRGGRLEPVKGVFRIDSQTGDTWVLQERGQGGGAALEWVRIKDMR